VAEAPAVVTSLERLAALEGDWRAVYHLRGDPSFDSDTQTTATITPVLGGRFVRIDYTWDLDDALDADGPQHGSLLVGHEPDAEPAPGPVTVVWIDSWHNDRRAMVCPGTLLDGGGVDVFGTFPAGDGPPWGWRTRIEPTTDGWSMKMWVVTPAGEESPAVDAAYRRALS
jgi:hypothetical protein